jgi:hypothetical protein
VAAKFAIGADQTLDIGLGDFIASSIVADLTPSSSALISVFKSAMR